MDIFANLTLGFSTALSWANLFYCFVGVVLGTLIGVLPGLGPVATIAMLLPVTFSFLHFFSKETRSARSIFQYSSAPNFSSPFSGAFCAVKIV